MTQSYCSSNQSLFYFRLSKQHQLQIQYLCSQLFVKNNLCKLCSPLSDSQKGPTKIILVMMSGPIFTDLLTMAEKHTTLSSYMKLGPSKLVQYYQVPNS